MIQTRSNQMKRSLTVPIFVSLLFHVAIFLAKTQKTHLEFQTQQPEQIIELAELPPTFINPPSTVRPPDQPNRPQVVETEDAGNRELDPNAQLLSDRNQKAQQQTRAARTDDFKSGKGSGLQGSETDSASLAPTGTPSEMVNSIDDLSVNEGMQAPQNQGTKRNWKTLSLKDLSVNGDGAENSSSDDYLPNITSGERTILSTREFRYFSYYNRIKELLRQYWKPSIEREVAKLWGKGRMLKEEELTTRVLVLLDQRGQIQKISKVGVSGFSEIDEAAIQAFHQAAPFPNPPNGLVDKDGFVRINWDFILKTASAPSIQFRPGNPGSGFRR